MIVLLKKISKKINRILRFKKPNKEIVSNVKESSISNEAVIDASTIVQYSELRGKVEIGPRSLISRVVLDGDIKIGSNTTINGPGTEFCSLINAISIGNFCSIARGTAIQEHNHNMENVTTYFIKYHIFKESRRDDVVSKGGVTIENDVWIGTGCTILSGVTIGNGAVVAANSVVTETVPPYAIVGGTPAKIIKYRFSEEVISKLLELEWWNWDLNTIKMNKKIFYNKPTLQLLDNVVLS